MIKISKQGCWESLTISLAMIMCGIIDDKRIRAEETQKLKDAVQKANQKQIR